MAQAISEITNPQSSMTAKVLEYTDLWNINVYNIVYRSLQIEVGTPEVFQVLELCSIFGLSSLESHCVDRIMSQLNTSNVCSVLSMAGNLVQKGSVCFNNVVDRCVMYIELHAKEVVDTEGFLQLSRDCLIQLISSDKVGVGGAGHIVCCDMQPKSS